MTERLRDLLTAYYTAYYHDELGIPDYEYRIKNRLREEEVFARPQIERLQKILRYSFSPATKVLVIGGGTGAEFIAFAMMGCDVYTIEPDEKAIEILNLKCRKHQLDPGKVSMEHAEHLSFPSDCFDLVYCFTVLEHVQDVALSIQEAIRVTKPLGYIYLNTPDYRQCYEGHYKLPLPLFLPKWMLKLLLRFHHRPTAFLDSLQFVTAKQLRNCFRRSNVVALQVYLPYEYPMKQQKGWSRIIRWMQDVLGIERNQQWILMKS